MAKPNCKYNKGAKEDVKFFYKYYGRNSLRFHLNDKIINYLIKKNLFMLCGFDKNLNIMFAKLTDFAEDMIKNDSLDKVLPNRIEDAKTKL